MKVLKRVKETTKRVKDINSAPKPKSKKTPGKKKEDYLYTLDRNIKHNGKKHKIGDKIKKDHPHYDVLEKYLY